MGKVHKTVVVATVCGVAFIVGVVVLLMGVYFYRRYRRIRRDAEEPPTSPKTTEDSELPDIEFYLKSVDGVKENGKEHHHHHQHHQHQHHQHHQHQKEKKDKDRPRKGHGDHNASYQKGKIKNEYTHIWEMPLPIPGEA